MAEGGGIIVPFRCLLNYLLLVCVVIVHSWVTTVSPIVCMFLYIQHMLLFNGLLFKLILKGKNTVTELFGNIDRQL